MLLIVADTLRADHLGAYGYPRDTSPFLDALAARAVVFEDVTSPASQTVPAVLSLWSSSWPADHGNQFFGATNSVRAPRRETEPRIPESLGLVGEYFRALGYGTAAVVSNPWLDPGFGFARGFDAYATLYESADAPYPEGHEVNDAARDRLERLPRPFFLYLHYMDPHHPYRPPREHREAFTAGLPGRAVFRNGPFPGARAADVAFTRALYDAEIRGLDDRLRELFEHLRALGLHESTLVVFTSDHGEEFREHGGMGHGWTLYEEVVRAPLLFWHAALEPRAHRVRVPVSLVDVLPTLLALVGAEAPPGLAGVSLAAQVRSESDDGALERRVLFSELGGLAAARRGPHKLIRARAGPAREEAFALAADPAERQPLAPAPAWRDELAEALAALDARAARRTAEAAGPH